MTAGTVTCERGLGRPEILDDCEVMRCAQYRSKGPRRSCGEPVPARSPECAAARTYPARPRACSAPGTPRFWLSSSVVACGATATTGFPASPTTLRRNHKQRRSTRERTSRPQTQAHGPSATGTTGPSLLVLDRKDLLPLGPLDEVIKFGTLAERTGKQPGHARHTTKPHVLFNSRRFASRIEKPVMVDVGSLTSGSPYCIVVLYITEVLHAGNSSRFAIPYE